VICLRDEGVDADKRKHGPGNQDPEGPVPVKVLINEPTNKWACARSDLHLPIISPLAQKSLEREYYECRRSKDRHWRADL
jgi:hypothetical protein